MKSFILKFKKIFLYFCICLFILFLVLFSDNNLLSAKNGLLLWANSVVPSLLPFFIATELLGYTNIVSLLGRLFNKFMKPVFNVPGEGAFPFIMGIISGYPIGAKIVSKFKMQGVCTSEEAERLLAFTNNSGPLFIIGTVGFGLFNNSNIGLLLFVTHILACLTVGFLFRWWKPNKNREKGARLLFPCNEVSFSNLGEILTNSIMSAINTVLLIGGFIVFFSVTISILQNSRILNFVSNIISPILNLFGVSFNFSNGIITGLLELTNGLSYIAHISNNSIYMKIIICAFLLGFGGISIMLQILSIASKSKISIKPYIIGKFLQGTFAAIYTYIFLNNLGISFIF